MKLVALQQFTYANVVLFEGDVFESCSDEDARLLKGFGKACDAPAMRRASMAMDAEFVKPIGRGRYRRNDMRAED